MRRVLGVGAAHYHCMSRICGGEPLLGEQEKAVLAKVIRQVAEFCGVEVLTFTVMSNHFHVLLFVPGERSVDDTELVRRYRVLYGQRRAPYQPKPEVLRGLFLENGPEGALWRTRLLNRMHDVSAFMKTVKQRFSVWFNKTHGRYGTLWADRFKSVLIEAEPRTLATVAAYIDLNAVRAGLVRDPANYRWCGYGQAMGGDPEARRGLGGVFGHDPGAWNRSAAAYRMVLFGKGARAQSEAGRIDRSRALKVLSGGGKVSVAEALRCRVRYFSDGVVLGSSAFVQAWIEVNVDQANRKRAMEPHAMEGSAWGGLAVSRGLRRALFA
jgi:putative transposase